MPTAFSLTGLFVGLGSFLAIGLFHPIVIKTEYYFGTRPWPIFLIAGLLCIAGSCFVADTILSCLLSVVGFSCLWSIHELLEQRKRVERGWFPRNPKRK